MSATFTYDGETVDVEPMRVGPNWNNAAFPLTCGHRHVTGDTVWQGPDSYADPVLACDRCVVHEATS